jgi:uncharacterized membrane protein
MKKSTLSALLVFFLLIPATLFFGTKLPGRGYYITSTLIILEMLVPFFLAFEGRKPQAREMVVIAVMCGIAIVSRVAIPIPHFKPTFAIIMLSGIAFGPEAGFMVGAITAFGSNFFAGQGAYTPWQMMAYGAGGLLAGFLSQKGWLSRKPVWLAVFGFLAVMLWIGPMLDICSIFLMPIGHSWEAIIAMFVSGVPANLSQGVCTVVIMLLFSKPLLEKLDRIKIKYGMMEAGDGI